jgi:hypothetical protein
MFIGIQKRYCGAQGTACTERYLTECCGWKRSPDAFENLE